MANDTRRLLRAVEKLRDMRFVFPVECCEGCSYQIESVNGLCYTEHGERIELDEGDVRVRLSCCGCGTNHDIEDVQGND